MRVSAQPIPALHDAMVFALAGHQPERGASSDGQGHAQGEVNEAARCALIDRIAVEIAIIEAEMSALRTKYGAAAEDSIAEMRGNQSVLLSTLDAVKHARSPREIQQARANVEVALRNSHDTRGHAAAACEAPAEKTKTAVAAAVAKPLIGSVAAKFANLPMNAANYQRAVAELTQRARQFVDGFAQQVAQQVEMAARHAVDIARSQQVQQQLVQQAKEELTRAQPAEAAHKLTEASTLALRDAERIRAQHDDAATRALVQRAEEQSTQALRQSIDQMQVDAQRDCTTQGHTGEALAACTAQGAAARIDVLRIRMVRIQVQVGETEDAATERMNRILRSVAPQDAQPQRSLPQNIEDVQRLLSGGVRPANDEAPRAEPNPARAQEAARHVMLVDVQVANVTVVMATTARPAETPAKPTEAGTAELRATSAHVMGPR